MRDIDEVVGLGDDARQLYDWMIAAFTGDVNEALALAKAHGTSLSKWSQDRLRNALAELKTRRVLTPSAPDLRADSPQRHHATKKSPAQLDHEIASILAGAPLPETFEVTAYLLRESSTGPGDLPRLVATAKPAKEITSSLAVTLSNLHASHDRSMGFISKPLAYSKAMPHGKREHANLIRLIKGGHVHVCEAAGAPPLGSIARRDAPYGDRYYMLHVGACGS